MDDQALADELLGVQGLLAGQAHGHLGAVGGEFLGDLGQEGSGSGRFPEQQGQ